MDATPKLCCRIHPAVYCRRKGCDWQLCSDCAKPLYETRSKKFTGVNMLRELHCHGEGFTCLVWAEGFDGYHDWKYMEDK